jgi:hypothetical protein
MVRNHTDFRPVTVVCEKKDFIDSHFPIIIPYYLLLLFDIGIQLVEQVHEVLSGHISTEQPERIYITPYLWRHTGQVLHAYAYGESGMPVSEEHLLEFSVLPLSEDIYLIVQQDKRVLQLLIEVVVARSRGLC